jgi:hypothetical protein
VRDAEKEAERIIAESRAADASRHRRAQPPPRARPE